MTSLAYIPPVLALLGCAAAAWTDFRTGRIPNKLTLSLLFLGLGQGAVISGPKGLLAATVGALVTALVPLILFRMRAMGGGDVKLFAALGTLLGPGVGLELQMAAFMVGAVQGVVIWIRRGQVRSGLQHSLRLFVPRRFCRPMDPNGGPVEKTEIRFGPAIFMGLLLAVSSRVLG